MTTITQTAAPETLALVFTMGREARVAGRPAAPALNRAVIDLIYRAEVRYEHAGQIALMDAYLQGWDEAHREISDAELQRLGIIAR